MNGNTKLLLIAVVVLFSISSVLVSVAAAGLDVQSVAEEEIQAIEQQGFRMPTLTLITVDRWNVAGNTLIAAQPVRYAIVLWNFYYWEALARKVVAHEVAHVLFSEANLPQSEALADVFVACFGSKTAQQWVRTTGDVRPSQAECVALGALLLRNDPLDESADD